jgi:hypothetical protein
MEAECAQLRARATAIQRVAWLSIGGDGYGVLTEGA